MSHVRRWGTAALALVALMFVVSSTALAQSDTVAISGFVRDPSGAVFQMQASPSEMKQLASSEK
jgi:hypothetical protein